MSEKILSIITVCYNSVNSIEDTILSVITQKKDFVEYIVIDGGSNDGTQDIINKYSDGIDKYISEPDEGISDAFNKGIDLAVGTYIGLLNSDDQLLSGSLDVITSNAQKSKFDILCFSMLIVNGSDSHSVISDSSRLDSGMYIAHPATYVKRNVYEKIGSFNKKYKLSMDYDFLLRSKKYGFKFQDINEIVVKMDSGGISDVHPFKAVAECISAYYNYSHSMSKTILFALNYGLRRILVRIIRGH